MRRFQQLLAKTRLSRAEVGNRAFDSAFFRPSGGAMRERWDTLRRGFPEERLKPAATAASLLLAYGSGSRGSLWLLEARDGRGEIMLGPRAQRALDRAVTLVSRELPALVSSQQTRSAWTVARISTDGESVLDGDSFGLSMCLAAAARSLGLSSPTGVAATAAVDGDGTLLEVGGLAEKLGVLHEWALGVETVIVASQQAESARVITEQLQASWQVAPARTVADAIAIAFPNLWTDLTSQWRSLTKLEQTARDLQRLARDGSNQLLGWKGIADAAAGIVDRLPDSSPARRDALFAQLVAARHEGQDALLELDREYLAGMRRPLRLRCLAHVVQSHGDCADRFEPSIESAASGALPSAARDDSADDLRLLGALGRTYAAFFRYQEAEVVLRRAVSGWFELGSTSEASYALSELLRVVALAGPPEAFRTLRQEFAEPFLNDFGVDAVSCAFMHYSIGRGHALLGELAAAAHCLSDASCDWAVLPDHLRALRLRWWLKVLRAQGAMERIADLAPQLAAVAERSPALAFVNALAALDRVLVENGDSAAPLRLLESLRPREFRRFADAFGSDVAERLAREYRY